MVQKQYDIEVITPMFLAGADPQKAEIRAASIKGQLRWWWRALHGELPLAELKKQEEEIFGSTKRKSSFSLVTIPSNINISSKNLPSGEKIHITAKGKTFPISIIDYLAYGIAEYQRGKGNVYKRPHIKPNSKFRIQLIFYNDQHMSEVEEALHTFINFGGLGSKSRNGFGSMKFLNNGNVNNKLPKKGNVVWKFTSFSNNSKLFIFNNHKKWEDALVEIGRIYREARLNLEPRHIFQRRPLVAKPLIVRDEGVFIEDRHAKQFFLHVDKVGTEYQGKILVLPYQYKDARLSQNYNKVINDMCKFIKSYNEEAKKAN